MDTKMTKKQDRIKDLVVNEKQQVEHVIFEDGEKLSRKDFIELFKSNLQTIIAGEIVTWEDVWRFTKQTDAKSFEMYLQNVEAEGILKGSKMSMNRQQKTSMMVFLLIIVGGIAAAVLLYYIFSKVSF